MTRFSGEPRYPVSFGVTALVVLALTLGVYWPGLNGPLILDDIANLDVLRILDARGELTLANVIADRGGFIGGRPLSWASFFLNYQLTGADVWAFKLVNLLIHIVNGVLVFLLARCLVRAVWPDRDEVWSWVALAVTAFWLLTPIQVSSVLYVVQRMTLLSATFCLLGLLSYSYGRLVLFDDRARGTVLIAAAFVICWPLSVLAKQNGALLVPLILVLEVFVFSPRDGSRWPLRFAAMLTALILIVGFARVAMDPQWLTAPYVLRDFSLLERLLTQPRVLADYVLNVLQLPGGAALGLFQDDFPSSTALWRPWSTALAMAGWIAVLVAAWLLRERPWGVILGGGVFFMVGHSLEAGPFALEMYFEHRNYLPSVGLWLAVMLGLSMLHERITMRRLVRALAVGLVLVHAALTSSRVIVWTSFEGIVESNVAAHPRSQRAQAGAAIVAFTASRLEDGLMHLGAVRDLGGPAARLPVLVKSLAGYCIAGRGPPPPVFAALEADLPVVANPYTVGALRWYRDVAETRDCHGIDETRVALRIADLVEERRDSREFGATWRLHSELSALLSNQQQLVRARRHLEFALRSAPATRSAELRARADTLPLH